MSSTSAQGLMALSSTLLGLSTITIALRFYARHVQKAPLKSDDWIMIPCLLYVVFDVFSTTTLGLTKIGALLFFRRIFCATGRRTFFAHLTLITIVTVALWVAAFDIFPGLACGTHFSALWTGLRDYDRYCQKKSWSYFLSLTISDFLLDFWILALPLPQIWALQTSLKRRVGVVGVFLLALVGVAACVVRLAVTVQIRLAGPKAIIDHRLANTRQLYLSVLENGLSLIAVNLPSLWCLITHDQLGSMLRSVRSIISLRSNSSATSIGKIPAPQPHLPSSLAKKGSDAYSNSSSSQTYFAHPEVHSFETYAMRGIGEGDFGKGLPRGEIRVTDSITQSAADV